MLSSGPEHITSLERSLLADYCHSRQDTHLFREGPNCRMQALARVCYGSIAASRE